MNNPLIRIGAESLCPLKRVFSPPPPAPSEIDFLWLEKFLVAKEEKVVK